jgi:hypothetical protein
MRGARNRLRHMLLKLDDMVVISARGAGCAILSGLAAYADAMQGFEPDLYLHPDFRDATAGGDIPTSDRAAPVAIARDDLESTVATIWTTDDLALLLNTDPHGHNQ